MTPAETDGDVALIPTGCDASSYSCVRSLGKRGIGSIVASERARVPAGSSKYCTQRAQVPDGRRESTAYRSALEALAAQPNVRTIIPVRPEDSYLLSRHHEMFAPHVSMVVPPMKQLRTVHDRLALAAAAEEAGVPVPATRPLGAVADWDDDIIIKSRFNVLGDAYLDTVGADALGVVKDLYHLPAGTAPDVDAIRVAMGHDPIVQEFIEKDGEYVFAALYDHGEPRATFQHRQIRGNSYTGGGGVYRKSVDIPALEAVGTTLLDHIGWHGLACIEYMKDRRTGEFVLTEVNPRMWQSLPVAVRAGADFPYYYWLQATGRADEIEPGYRTGVGSHLLAGELGYFWSLFDDDSPVVSRPSIPRAAWEILASCVRDPHFDYLYLDDLRPFATGLQTKVGSSLKR